MGVQVEGQKGCYTALSAEEAKEYGKVKKAILARYDINLESYQRCL